MLCVPMVCCQTSHAVHTHAYAHDAHVLAGLTMHMPSVLPTTSMRVKAIDDDDAMTMGFYQALP